MHGHCNRDDWSTLIVNKRQDCSMRCHGKLFTSKTNVDCSEEPRQRHLIFSIAVSHSHCVLYFSVVNDVGLCRTDIRSSWNNMQTGRMHNIIDRPVLQNGGLLHIMIFECLFAIYVT